MTKTENFSVSLTKGLADRLDKFKEENGFLSNNEAIRQIIRDRLYGSTDAYPRRAASIVDVLMELASNVDDPEASLEAIEAVYNNYKNSMQLAEQHKITEHGGDEPKRLPSVMDVIMEQGTIDREALLQKTKLSTERLDKVLDYLKAIGSITEESTTMEGKLGTVYTWNG